MICYYYPPIKSMGVMRSHALSHEWLKHFKSVSVITTDNNARLTKESLSIDAEIEVVSVPTFDYRTITSLYSSKSHYSESSKKSGLGQFAVKFLNSFPFNKWIGEGGYRYENNAFRKAVELIENNNIGYIYSSFRPHADHRVAARIKKRFPQLKWTADFRDIHVDALKKNVFFTAYQHRMNKKLLRNANVVTTVSNGCADHIRAYSPDVHVIYNGVKENREGPRVELHQKFTFSYTGSLYGQMRDPSSVFRVLRELVDEGRLNNDFQIVYAGKDSSTWQQWIDQYDLQNWSDIKGLCSHEESRNIQYSSHINLQLTFAHPEVTGAITGKLMEYIQAKRPILCLINGSQDIEIEEFFTSVSKSIVVYNEKRYLDQIRSYILKLYEQFKSGNLNYFETPSDILKEFTWDVLANKFVRLLDADQ